MKKLIAAFLLVHCINTYNMENAQPQESQKKDDCKKHATPKSNKTPNCSVFERGHQTFSSACLARMLFGEEGSHEWSREEPK